MVILILLILGLCLGSFINAFVWRFHEQSELRQQQAVLRADTKPKSTISKHAEQIKTIDKRLDDLSISKGRSMCVHCEHELAPRDLVPVFSFLALRGKCRYCRKPIPDTPLAELVTPLLFIVSYLAWPLSMSGAGLFSFCVWLIILVGLIALMLYDIRWHELPHEIVFWLTVLAVTQIGVMTLVFDGQWSDAGESVLGGLILSGIFALIYRLSPKFPDDESESDDDHISGLGSRVFGFMFGWLTGNKTSMWIGGGDITLGLLLGILVGGPANALLLLFVASLLGTLVALPLLATGKATRTTHLPFGPFLITAAIFVMLWGERLLDWYTNHLLLS